MWFQEQVATCSFITHCAWEQLMQFPCLTLQRVVHIQEVMPSTVLLLVCELCQSAMKHEDNFLGFAVCLSGL